MHRSFDRSPRSRVRPQSNRGLLSVATGLAMLCLFLGPGAIQAAEIEDVAFPERIRVGDGELALHGLGLLRYRVIFRGYVGGLYLPEGVAGDRVLDDVPKALELSYFWAIEGRLFGEAAEKILADALPASQIEPLQDRLDRLAGLYRDVEPGDRYRLSYEPGRGTTLLYNGEPLGTIPGADFAAAYFSIWLGDDPLSTSFRDQLLAGLEEASGAPDRSAKR